MSSQAQTAPFYPAITKSQILVQAGVTKIPGDIIGEVESKVQSVGILFGWNITESTGLAIAKVRLWDGTTKEGNYLATIDITKEGGNTDFFSSNSIELHNNAIFCEVVSGSIEGVVWYG